MERVAADARAPEGARSLHPLVRRTAPPRGGRKRGTFRAAQEAVFARAAARGLLPARGLTIAVDATGLEAHHASFHYTHRVRAHGRRRPKYPPHPKLTLAIETRSHLIAGAFPSTGPGPDAAGFAPVMRQAAALLGRGIGAVVADAGFDSESAHRLSHRSLGIRRTAIRLNPRGTRKWPKTRYRREMRQHFPWRVYRRRAQVECLISRAKRRLGSALTARRADTRRDEQILRVLTLNLMILHRERTSFQQSRSDPDLRRTQAGLLRAAISVLNTDVPSGPQPRRGSSTVASRGTTMVLEPRVA